MNHHEPAISHHEPPINHHWPAFNNHQVKPIFSRWIATELCQHPEERRMQSLDQQEKGTVAEDEGHDGAHLLHKWLSTMFCNIALAYEC